MQLYALGISKNHNVSSCHAYTSCKWQYYYIRGELFSKYIREELLALFLLLVFCVIILFWYFAATAWPPSAAAVSWTPASEERGREEDDGRRRIQSTGTGTERSLTGEDAASLIISCWALSLSLFITPCSWTSAMELFGWCRWTDD
jgi:hypothetical protein